MTEPATPSEPQGNAGDAPAEPTIESLTAEVEKLKSHSRKWEDRAKENFTKAQELDALKLSQMSDSEKATEALTAAEKRAAKAEEDAATAARDALRFRIAAKHSISDEDADLYLTGTDEETLTRQAEGLATRGTESPRPPRPNPSQGNRGAVPVSTNERGGALLGDLFS